MTSSLKRLAIGVSLVVGVFAAAGAEAQIKVGVVLSVTGPGASLGIPEKNTIALMPKEIGGRSVEYLVLDDASDSTTAVKNIRKLTSEDQVDVVVGSTLSPNSIAMTEVAAESGTPMISIAGLSRIVEPMDAKKAWVFKTPQHDGLMADAIAEHMAKSGIKTIAFIAQGDAYGEGWSTEMTRAAGAQGVAIAVNERFARTDQSVTGQVLKIMAANPDAVMIAAAGTPAALPAKTLRERGYKGAIYQSHGVANADFIRVGGKDVEGTFLPAGPILVADQLPDANPVKVVALDYFRKYEAANGAGTISTFGAHAWDSGLMLQNAIPEALKKAQPGTPAFRKALRDALEGIRNLTVTHGIMTMSPTNHNGLDARGRVMVRIDNGKWKLIN